MPEPPTYVTKWTVLLFQLNALLDKGERLEIAETSRHIDDGTLFEWLRERFPFPQLDLGFYEPNVLYPRDVMIEVLQRIDNAVGAHKLGVTQNGLAQLVAYGLQALQQAE